MNTWVVASSSVRFERERQTQCRVAGGGNELGRHHTVQWREVWVVREFLDVRASVVYSSELYWLAARAVHLRISPVALAFVWAGVFLLGRLPISIANLGVREVTVVSWLAFYRVDGPTALAMSLVVFSAAVVMALIGALCQPGLFTGGRGERRKAQ